MLFDYAYLLNDFDASFFEDENMQACDFIFPVTGEIVEKEREILQVLLRSKNRFCFYIPLELTRHSKFIKGQIIQNIVRFLFLPNYVRIDHKHVFFTEKVNEENKAFEELKLEFYSELRKQGINDFIVEAVQVTASSENVSDEKCISLYHIGLNNYLNGDNERECFEVFTDNFVFPENFHKKWIVPVADQDSFRNKSKLLEKFENWISYTNPFTAKLIAMYGIAIRNKILLESDNTILRFKLDSFAYSLKVIRDEAANHMREVLRLRAELQRGKFEAEHHRANEILSWYQKEYEVLPLWYKRFGHIIKVFTGKRTFTSLFK
jgi:hypothetical protein